MKRHLIVYVLFFVVCHIKTSAQSASITVRSEYLTSKDTLEVYIYDDIIGNPFLASGRRIQSVNQNGLYHFNLDTLTDNSRFTLCLSYQKMRGQPAYGIFEYARIYPGDDVHIALIPAKGKYMAFGGGYDLPYPIFLGNWACTFLSGKAAKRMDLEYRLNKLREKEMAGLPWLEKAPYERLQEVCTRFDDLWAVMKKFLEDHREGIVEREFVQLYYDEWGYAESLKSASIKRIIAFNRQTLDKEKTRNLLDSLLSRSLSKADEIYYSERAYGYIQSCTDLFLLLSGLEKGHRSLSFFLDSIEDRDIPQGIKERIITNAMLDVFGAQAERNLYHRALASVENVKLKDRLRGFGVLVNEETSLDFELPDVLGDRHRLSDYRGKMVLIDFWYMGCIPCRQYMENVLTPFLQEHAEKYNLQVILVSLDDKNNFSKAISSGIVPQGALALYTENLKFKHPLIEQLRIISYPYPMLLNENGKILKVGKELKSLESLMQVLDNNKGGS